MKISWFIPEDNYYVRVEEDLVKLGENEIIFAQKGKQYKLESSYNLKEMLIDDVLYAFQYNGRLHPMRGSNVFNPEILLRKYIDIEPDQLKEIIESATLDLRKEIKKLKNLISFEMKKNAEEDIKKMDFLKGVDAYRDILYKKFLDFFKEHEDEMRTSLAQKEQSKNQKDPSGKAKIPIKQRKLVKKPVKGVSRHTKSATTESMSPMDAKMRVADNKSKKVELKRPSKKAAIRQLFDN